VTAPTARPAAPPAGSRAGPGGAALRGDGMGTHRLVTPQGDVVERPCSAYCRDGRHAVVHYGVLDEGPEEVGRQIMRHNPGLRILAVERAGEIAPPPDVLAHFAGWDRDDLIGYVLIYEPAERAARREGGD
jgi:hypothetical protein